MAGLEYKNQLDIVAGGYDPTKIPGADWEWHNTTGRIEDWTPVSGTSGSMTAKYYYHDSWIAKNAISSRVWVTISDRWQVLETTPDNHIKVRITSTIDRIERVAKGSAYEGSWNCLGYNWSTWHIMIYKNRDKSGGVVSGGNFANLSATVNQVISSTPISLGTYDIDLPPLRPGDTPYSRGTVFYQSSVTGHEDDADGSSYVDRMWMGLNFRNTLPYDYRPGKVLDGDGNWQSHNRNRGAADVLTSGGSWQTMRTNDGAVGADNPPLILSNNGYKNMRKIGLNA